MENEISTEINENEYQFLDTSNEMESQEVIEESNAEDVEFIDETNFGNDISIDSSISYIEIVEDQFNILNNNINNIFYCNFIILATLFTFLIYHFLHNFYERRKI